MQVKSKSYIRDNTLHFENGRIYTQVIPVVNGVQNFLNIEKKDVTEEVAQVIQKYIT